MIAIRRCKKCGEEFEAIVGKDKNIYCEKCRDVMILIEDEKKYRDEDMNIEPEKEASTAVSEILMEDIRKNLKVFHNKNANIDSGRSFRNKSSKNKKVPTKTNTQTELIDSETLAFLDAMKFDT